MTLYELTDEYRQLLEMASDPDIPADVLADTLEGLDGEIEDKADGYAKVIAQLNADAEALKKEVARLSDRRKVLEGNADRMKASLQKAMEITGKRKFKTALFSFGIQKNPASLKIIGEVPDTYMIPQEPKIDTAGIKEALKAGETLSFACMEQKESLRIR